jgi:hypothetical protein
MESYTVLEPSKVKELLSLSYSPVGINVEKRGSEDSCVVECVPPSNKEPFDVSDKKLEELLNEGVIEKK